MRLHPCGQDRRRAAVASALVIRCTISTVRRLFLVTVRRSWATCTAPLKSIHAGTSTTLIVRVARRPCPRSVLVTAGTDVHGRALSCANNDF
ncbi:hypothetical protein [Streptomyces sp. NPDC001758]